MLLGYAEHPEVRKVLFFSAVEQFRGILKSVPRSVESRPRNYGFVRVPRYPREKLLGVTALVVALRCLSHVHVHHVAERNAAADRR